MASDGGVTEGGAGADLPRSRGSLKRRLSSEPGGGEKRARVSNNKIVNLRDLADRGIIFLGVDYEIDENGQLKLLDSSSGAQRDALWVAFNPAANPKRDLTKLRAFIRSVCDPVPRQLTEVVDRVPGAQAPSHEITTWLRDLIRATSRLHADATIAVIQLRNHLDEPLANHPFLEDAIPSVFDFLERTYGHTIYTSFMHGARMKFDIATLPFFHPEDDRTFVNLMLQGQFTLGTLNSPQNLRQWMWEQTIRATLYAVQVDFTMSLVTRAIILSEGLESANDAMRGTLLGGVQPLEHNLELFFALRRKVGPYLKQKILPCLNPMFTYDVDHIDAHVYITSRLGPMLRHLTTQRGLARRKQMLDVADEEWQVLVPKPDGGA
ncbi:hypothetical protein PGQ11_007024 [Apiospora arundinis]|uniref:Uncharacterized protein n=1 Tax=Apiospora arundinis TaxID=335852 RepID=A0ABR2IUI3_9PEZI